MDTSVDKKFSLKDHLFNKKSITKIADEIHQVYPEFDQKNFVKKVIAQFSSLELIQRVKWIRENLKTFLPDDYRGATTILLKSLPPHKDGDQLDNDFGEYIYAPYTDFVATYGCTQKDLDFSFKALKEMTKRFSAEDAIRYFVNAFPKETLQEILKWSIDADYHVRRLASEGTRPRLPWSQKITLAPEEPLPILENLFSDKSRFVTRSVANHINDIAKINPELVIKTLRKWQESEKQNQKEMEYIINHGLRTLIKQGDKNTITFLQFSTNPEVTIGNFHIKETPITIGNSLEFTFTVTAQKDEKLIIDYILYFHNRSGNGHNKKVFKLKKVTMKKEQTIEVIKKHLLKQMSTRTLYPGYYKIAIQINGNNVAEKEFEVIV